MYTYRYMYIFIELVIYERRMVNNITHKSNTKKYKT